LVGREGGVGGERRGVRGDEGERRLPAVCMLAAVAAASGRVVACVMHAACMERGVGYRHA